jgi:inorganic pyrophosphatase
VDEVVGGGDIAATAGETVSAPELICRIEQPKGSLLEVGIVAGEEDAIICPADYGYLPDTIGHAGAPLETVVCGSAPGRAGTFVAGRPVAVVHVAERVGEIEVVVCVACHDREWDGVDAAEELPSHLREAIERFVLGCRPLDGSGATLAWGSRADAMATIDDAAARWAATVDGRG